METAGGAGADHTGPDRGWVAPDTGSAPSPPAPAAAPAPSVPSTRVEPPVPLRPLTTADVLDGAFAVITRRPRTVLTIAAVVVVPVQLLAAWASRSSVPSSELFTGFLGADTTLDAGSLVASVAALLLENLSMFVLGAAVAALVASWYGGGDLSVGAALKAAVDRGGALLGAWALLVPVKAVAAAPEYLGLVFVTPLFALTAPAIVLERLGPFAGAKRSWQLVGRRLFPCIGIVLLVSLVAYVLRQVLAIPGVIVAFFLPASIAWVPVGVATAAASLLTQSALAGASVLLYLDLRVRTEGLDLELTADDAFRPPTA